MGKVRSWKVIRSVLAICENLVSRKKALLNRSIEKIAQGWLIIHIPAMRGRTPALTRKIHRSLTRISKLMSQRGSFPRARAKASRFAGPRPVLTRITLKI